MPTLPWIPVHPAPGPDVVVMATHFTLKRLRDVPAFLRDALRVVGQIRRSPGAVGLSLVARPFRREFQTLSAWADQESITAMVRAEPHRSVMGNYRDATEKAVLTSWTAPVSDLPPAWADVRRRLSARS